MKKNHRRSVFLLLQYSFVLFSFIEVSAHAQPPEMRASVTPIMPGEDNFTLHGKSPTGLKRDTSKIIPKHSSEVFFSRSQYAIESDFNVNASVVQKMVDHLVCDVTGKSTVAEAWRSLIKTGAQGDRVGIKVATEPGVISGTHREIAQALVTELIKAGVKRENILIWDRRRQDLEAAGYTKIPSLQLRWIEYGGGYDPKTVFSSPVVGQLMYGDSTFKESPHSLKEILNPHAQFSTDSHYAIILSREVNKVINVASLCDSYYSGINGALANMTIRNIDNWRRFIKDPFFGDPYIANIYNTDVIKGKVIMTMMDGLTLQYAGGPRPNPSHAMLNGMIFASFDPVAIDSMAIRLIDEQRIVNHLPKIDNLAGHVQSAESLKLGNAAPAKISLIPTQ